MTPGRRRLGRFELDVQTSRSIDETGLLELVFSRHPLPDAELSSLDGARTIARLQPSGALGVLLVQDSVDAEGLRRIPFVFGVVELVNDGATVTVFLETNG
jgi:hypothetical protein